MADTDEFSLYGSMEHATSELQKIERQRLWEIQVTSLVTRVRARVIDEKFDEEFNAWVQEFDPQVCSCCTTIYTKKIIDNRKSRTKQAS